MDSVLHLERTNELEKVCDTETSKPPEGHDVNILQKNENDEEQSDHRPSAVKDFSGWECPKCTYRNIPTRPGCEICAEERPRIFSSPQKVSQLQDVESAETSNDDEAELPTMSNNDNHCVQKVDNNGCWECPKCTFVNKPNRPGCEICATDNPQLMKRQQHLITEQSGEQAGWECPSCSHLNKPTRPGCETCATDRPEDYKPENQNFYLAYMEELDKMEKEERFLEQWKEQQKNNFDQLMISDDKDLIPNTEVIECLICYTEIQPNEGIKLHNCLHDFCRECIVGTIENSENVEVSCPYKNDDYQCSEIIQDREVRALLPEESYSKQLQKSLVSAESQNPNSYHCKTPNCEYWCICEPQIKSFMCEICGKTNCIECKTIHEGQSCVEYQEEMKRNVEKNEELAQTEEHIQTMLQNGEAMKCPDCKALIMKHQGCDALRCKMCKLQLCWATKGRRWGPKGSGDTSDGCRCTHNARCTPTCKGCDYPHGG